MDYFCYYYFDFDFLLMSNFVCLLNVFYLFIIICYVNTKYIANYYN